MPSSMINVLVFLLISTVGCYGQAADSTSTVGPTTISLSTDSKVSAGTDTAASTVDHTSVPYSVTMDVNSTLPSTTFNSITVSTNENNSTTSSPTFNNSTASASTNENNSTTLSTAFNNSTTSASTNEKNTSSDNSTTEVTTPTSPMTTEVSNHTTPFTNGSSTATSNSDATHTMTTSNNNTSPGLIWTTTSPNSDSTASTNTSMQTTILPNITSEHTKQTSITSTSSVPRTTSSLTEATASTLMTTNTSDSGLSGNVKDSVSTTGVILGAIIGSILGITLVCLVVYFLCGPRKSSSFSHRRLYEDIRNEPVLRLDNPENPYDVSFGDSSYYNPTALEEPSYNNNRPHEVIVMDDMSHHQP